MTGNHNIYDSRVHSTARDVLIGNYCKIVINAVMRLGLAFQYFMILSASFMMIKFFQKATV